MTDQPRITTAPDAPPDAATFVLWLDASDGSIPAHDGVRWPDGTVTIHHRNFPGITSTHSSPEAACQAAHGKQGRIAWDNARTTPDNHATSSDEADNGLRQQIAAAIREATCNGDCGASEEQCVRQRIQPVVWHFGVLAEVSGSPEMFADAVLAVLERHLDIGEEQAWCKTCRRVWEGRSHRCEGDAEAAVARVRRLCEMTIAASVRVQAIDQARDTLAALDGPSGEATR